jgi:hypothetical protein
MLCSGVRLGVVAFSAIALERQTVKAFIAVSIVDSNPTRSDQCDGTEEGGP